MHVNLKNMPRMRLADLLRRRKMTLAQFVKESGIQAYGAMIDRCRALGVQPPSEEEYLVVVPVPVSVQQDGVVVIEALDPVSTQQEFEFDPHFGQIEVEIPDTQKKPKKKKESQQQT
jgi:hypothetical protein